ISALMIASLGSRKSPSDTTPTTPRNALVNLLLDLAGGENCEIEYIHEYIESKVNESKVDCCTYSKIQLH
ncbi:MAG: hypothetical protein AAF766_19715, partial [Cyanobacteria bacterium P01_D01_bin.14]